MTNEGSAGSVRPDLLPEALAPFLREVSRAFGGNLTTAADHLRYPAVPPMTLTGSLLGAQIWDSDAARDLLQFLMRDPDLAEWFGRGGPLSSFELRAMLASVVSSWAASGEGAEQYCRSHAQKIIDALKEDPRSCWAFGLIYGVGTGQRIDLPYGLAIDPGVETVVNNLVADGVLSESEAMKVPKGYSCLFLQGAAVSRSEWGSLAATTAAVWRHIAFRRLSTCVWLTTGVLPVIGDVFVTELSAYPVTPFQHVARSLQTYPSSPEIVLGEQHVSHLRSAIIRLEGVLSASQGIDQETALQLRLALSHTEAVLTTADSLLASLLSYVAIEGLLLYEGDEASRLGPRVAWMLGADDSDRKRVGAFMEAFGRLRGNVGHGNPPQLETLSRLLGRRISNDEVDVYFTWSGRESGKALEQACRTLLQKVLRAFLSLALTVGQDDQASDGLTRRQIIEMLEVAARRGSGWKQAARHLEANARALFGLMGPAC